MRAVSRGFDVLVSARGNSLNALLDRFARSERLPAARIEAEQFELLGLLLAHASRHVPFYAKRLADFGYAPEETLTAERWRQLPLLTRANVQSEFESLRSQQLPPGIRVAGEVHTSGSTGRPIRVIKTEVEQLLWEALTLRDHRWHRRDFSGTLAGIRWYPDGVAAPPQGQRWKDWGVPVSHMANAGPSFGLSIAASSAEQAAWLASVQPDYLVAYPSLLPELARACRAQGVQLTRLKHIRTVSECVDAATRALCREAWNVPVQDIYSAQEVGYIALQCPDSDNYHVQAESAYIEILNDAGASCAAGEIGRVVVTPLYNFAMPLLRYEIGDYAEAGAACTCGRGLPVITRILGRTRNMLTLPDGNTLWPRLSELRYSEILPVEQFQLVQKSASLLELRLVAARRASATEEQQLRELIISRIGHAFDLQISYPATIARGATGKFEDFRSEWKPGIGHDSAHGTESAA